jgi:hypothetical protein
MLIPGRLTLAVRRLSPSQFIQRTGCRSVLMLRVPDDEQELAWGLNQDYGEGDDLVSDQPKVLDFHTAIAGSQATYRRRGGPVGAEAPGFELDDLANWISAARCFAIPLEQFSGRILVGRARNKHLSLRSQNISKLHAWFEYDPAGRLLLADAGSKNGTSVDGVRIAPRQPVAVKHGVELRFGPLEATLCSVEQFWEIASLV